nr:MAG TPA: hypothetical protein [Caudoviricetes sp.]
MLYDIIPISSLHNSFFSELFIIQMIIPISKVQFLFIIIPIKISLPAWK